MATLKTAADFAAELGRSQKAYQEYGAAGRKDLQKESTAYADKLRSQASTAGVDLSGLGTQNRYGTDFTQYANGGGVYDTTKAGRVEKPITVIQADPGTPPAPDTPAAAPSAPPSFSYSGPPALSWDQALGQSHQRLDPILERALTGVDSQRYQDQLDTGQIASNMGGAHSGLAADAQNKVFIAASGKKADLTANRDAQAADMANALVTNSQDRADRLQSQAFNEWIGQQQLGLSRDQLGLQRDQFDWGKVIDSANQTGSFNGQRNLAGQQLDLAAKDQTFNHDFQNKQFAYTKVRDQIQDKQWQKQFDEDTRRYGLDYALNKQVQLGQLSIQQSQLALQRSNMASDNARQASSAGWGRLMDVWKATGQAPAGIQGVSQGTPWGGTTNSNAFSADVMNGLSKFNNSNDALGWLHENAGEITKQLGVSGFQSMQSMLPSFYGENNNGANVKKQATDAAMKDPSWAAANAGERQVMINEYMRYFQ